MCRDFGKVWKNVETGRKVWKNSTAGVWNDRSEGRFGAAAGAGKGNRYGSGQERTRNKGVGPCGEIRANGPG